MKKSLICLLALLAPVSYASNVVVIGHSSVPKIDIATVQKIYTGKVIAVGGVNVMAVNAKASLPMRRTFLQEYLNQDDEKYIAYWTVRRYIGKGAPPIELASTNEIISYVQANPGAIAYIDEAELRPGLNVIAKK